MRFVVFLDIDGVLNTRTTARHTPYGYTGIDDARVKILASSIEKYGGGDIVLSSDWKVLDPDHEDYKYLVSKLRQCNLEILGHTVDTERKRGKGIKEYCLPMASRICGSRRERLQWKQYFLEIISNYFEL